MWKSVKLELWWTFCHKRFFRGKLITIPVFKIFTLFFHHYEGRPKIYVLLHTYRLFSVSINLLLSLLQQQQNFVFNNNKCFNIKSLKSLLLFSSKKLPWFIFQLPSTMWSEEYHIDLLREHFRAFDSLRTSSSDRFLTGEMIWNFADFATQQG